MKLRLPLFILFEGIDGSGKSTLSDAIYHYYKNLGIPTVKIMEPTDGIWGQRIREMLNGTRIPAPEEQLELFLSDREDDVRRNILPSLKKSRMIIMDRYYYSTAAYQGAMGLSPEYIIDENMRRGFPKPDRVYLIDIEPEKSLKRIADRDSGIRDGDLFEKRRFLERVRRIYLSIANESFCILDGDAGIEELSQIVRSDIESHFRV
jgi:dTMP kinase